MRTGTDTMTKQKSTNTFKNRHIERQKDPASAYVFPNTGINEKQFCSVDEILEELTPQRLKTKQEMQKDGIWEIWSKDHPEEAEKMK